MDTIDNQIVEILQADSSKSNIEIAEKIGTSEATVRRRINRLVDIGLIRGYYAMINYEKVIGTYLKSYIYLDIDTSQLDSIIERILAEQELCTFYRCIGSEYNLMCGFIFKNINMLQNFIDELRVSPGIKKVDFHIITGTYRRCPILGV